jgi:acetoin utilization deacetylase AcuC-like enzyme
MNVTTDCYTHYQRIEVNDPRRYGVVVVKYHVYYSPDFVASDYAFDTTRKSGELAALIKATSTSAEVVDPSAYTQRTKELISAIHAPSYVAAVTKGTPSELAESQGFEWDPKISTMATAHAAGLVAAVTEVLTSSANIAGSLSSGLHHARKDRGNGYCTFNGLAVSAHVAAELGAERVLILDLDAHCGGGTRSMTDSQAVVQVDVSTSSFDTWSPTGYDALLMATADNYLDRISEALNLANRAGGFDLVLYNAGMDPANFGVRAADLKKREQMVAEWISDRGHHLVYALAGGYTGQTISMGDLVGLHNFTVDAFG